MLSNYIIDGLNTTYFVLPEWLNKTMHELLKIPTTTTTTTTQTGILNYPSIRIDFLAIYEAK